MIIEEPEGLTTYLCPDTARRDKCFHCLDYITHQHCRVLGYSPYPMFLGRGGGVGVFSYWWVTMHLISHWRSDAFCSGGDSDHRPLGHRLTHTHKKEDPPYFPFPSSLQSPTPHLHGCVISGWILEMPPLANPIRLPRLNCWLQVLELTWLAPYHHCFCPSSSITASILSLSAHTSHRGKARTARTTKSLLQYGSLR